MVSPGWFSHSSVCVFKTPPSRQGETLVQPEMAESCAGRARGSQRTSVAGTFQSRHSFSTRAPGLESPGYRCRTRQSPVACSTPYARCTRRPKHSNGARIFSRLAAFSARRHSSARMNPTRSPISLAACRDRHSGDAGRSHRRCAHLPRYRHAIRRARQRH